MAYEKNIEGSSCVLARTFVTRERMRKKERLLLFGNYFWGSFQGEWLILRKECFVKLSLALIVIVGKMSVMLATGIE